jgi:hypothetical protein
VPGGDIAGYANAETALEQFLTFAFRESGLTGRTPMPAENGKMTKTIANQHRRLLVTGDSLPVLI